MIISSKGDFEMKSEAFIKILIGNQDHSVKKYRCKHCKTVQSTHESDRICICGGGFICPKCKGINKKISRSY